MPLTTPILGIACDVVDKKVTRVSISVLVVTLTSSIRNVRKCTRIYRPLIYLLREDGAVSSTQFDDRALRVDSEHEFVVTAREFRTNLLAIIAFCYDTYAGKVFLVGPVLPKNIGFVNKQSQPEDLADAIQLDERYTVVDISNEFTYVKQTDVGNNVPAENKSVSSGGSLSLRQQHPMQRIIASLYPYSQKGLFEDEGRHNIAARSLYFARIFADLNYGTRDKAAVQSSIKDDAKLKIGNKKAGDGGVDPAPRLQPEVTEVLSQVTDFKNICAIVLAGGFYRVVVPDADDGVVVHIIPENAKAVEKIATKTPPGAVYVVMEKEHRSVVAEPARCLVFGDVFFYKSQTKRHELNATYTLWLFTGADTSEDKRDFAVMLRHVFAMLGRRLHNEALMNAYCQLIFELSSGS